MKRYCLIACLVLPALLLTQCNNSTKPTTPSGPSFLPEMVNVAAGSFMMGSLDTTDFYMAIPQHSVSVSAFSMSKYPVTEGLYDTVMDTNPSHWPTPRGDRSNWEKHPVEQISWYNAIQFCNKLSKLASLDTVYSYTDTADGEMNGLNINYSKNGYRMPTEAEYEYAQRAGTTTDFYWGKNYPPLTVAESLAVNANAAWYYGGADTQTVNVGTKPANPFGLYDMAGNVFTWCNDRFDGSYQDVAGGSNPTGATSGDQRICRGGSWGYFNCGQIETAMLASPNRWYMYPYMNGWMVGLRVVRGH